MQNFGKIITGIVIFLVLLAIPVIVTQASGNMDYVTESELQLPDPSVATECIESTEYMRVHHMDLLLKWRSWAVRDDSRGDENISYYTATDGDEWFMSLTETCLGCHDDRDAFCNVCHDYMAVQPNCWDCHNDVSEGS
jgi:hypothetical protein